MTKKSEVYLYIICHFTPLYISLYSFSYFNIIIIIWNFYLFEKTEIFLFT